MAAPTLLMKSTKRLRSRGTVQIQTTPAHAAVFFCSAWWGRGGGGWYPGLHCIAVRGNMKSAVHPHLVHHGKKSNMAECDEGNVAPRNVQVHCKKLNISEERCDVDIVFSRGALNGNEAETCCERRQRRRQGQFVSASLLKGRHLCIVRVWR